MSTTIVLNPEQLATEYTAYKVSKAKHFSGPSQANRCSVLGHPCLAYCYFDRTVDSVHRMETSAHLAGIFDEGRNQERMFSRDLAEMGWDCHESQGSLAWKKYNITGHRDFIISKNGSAGIRCEFKSVHPLLWTQLNSPQDIRNHKRYFIQKWYAQVVLYMLLDGQETYWLIMKNKSTGEIKAVVFDWNDETYQDAENYVKKAENVNNLVQIGNIWTEDKLSDADICGGCEFLNVCNPPLDFGVGVEIVDEETAAELAEMAKRRSELQTAADEWEDLDEELKDRVKGLAGSEKVQLVFGDWAANIKRQNVKEEKVPRKAFTKTIISFQHLVVDNSDLTDVLQQSVDKAGAK